MKTASKLSILFLSFAFLTAKSQTYYGVTGLIKTPSAYIVTDGKCNLGVATFKDYFQSTSPELFQQNAIFFNVGFHSRLEVGIRLIQLPDKYIIEDPLSGKRQITDRVINAKLVILKEKKNQPQLAFGMQDIVGTRFHNSTYLVASKTIDVNPSVSFLTNIGYGTKLNDLIFGDAYNHHFIGAFGGAEFGIKKIVFINAEYDARDFNAGLRFVPANWLDLKIASLKMETIAAALSFKFKL